MAHDRAETADGEARLDKILADYLDAVEAGTAPGRDELLARHPDLADELRAFFRDEDQFGSLVAPLRTPGPAAPTEVPPASPDGAGRAVGDYDLLEEVARGGMGVVWRARQRSLNRLVALKMILAGEFATPEAVQRFRMEAEAAAALDHPHIVPIYEIGAHNGQPYFSMKLIEGGNLCRHVERLGRDPRAAARLVATAARAVHYAHQHGILHRDLKPANLLLDAEGHPHLTDFGLAKRVAGLAPTAAGTESAPPLTGSGAAVGTPSYMAPEQAAGHGRGLTTAADVYGLGAILYELLAGRPPFRGATPLDTLSELLHREPAAPRALRPGVPRDLETICLKCLRKEPGQRYPSAAALADDLQRFLAGESVLARRAGRLERLGRWCRRNPALALSGGLAAAALVGFAVVSGLYAAAESRHATSLAEQQRQTEAALARAERAAGEAHEQAELAGRQRARAEDSFQQAHQAVNDCVQASEELARVPGLQPLRKALLTAALRYYQHFLEQHGDDPGLRADLADTYRRVGRITGSIGSKAEALAAYRRALPLYRELARARPENARWQTALIETLIEIAALRRATGGPAADARADAEQALALCEPFARAKPENLTRLDLLAGTYHVLANLEQADGHTEAALAHFAQARSLWQQLACVYQSGSKYPGELALCVNNAGVLYFQRERFEEAARCFEEARAIREKQAEEHPREAGALIALAASYRDLGVTCGRLGRHDDSLRYRRLALDIRSRLAGQNPSVVLYQSDLATSLVDMGRFHLGHKRFPEALDCFRQAVAIDRKLADIDPSVAGHRKAQAAGQFQCGEVLSASGKLEEAVRAYGEARAVQEAIVRDDPGDAGARADLVRTLNNLGLTLERLGRHEEALAALHPAVAQARAVSEQAPLVQEHRRTWSTCCGALAQVARAAGRPEESAAALLERRRLCADNPQELYRVARELALTADVVGRGQAELSPAQAAQRHRHADEALATLRQAVRQGYRDAERLRRDRALAALRGRADFQELLADLATAR